MDLCAVRCRGSSRSESRISRSSPLTHRCVDGYHEADPVIASSEVHGVVEPIDNADALPHDVGQAGHVDVVQFALDVAGFHQCDISMVLRVVGVIWKVAWRDEPLQQLLDDRLAGSSSASSSRSAIDVNVIMKRSP